MQASRGLCAARSLPTQARASLQLRGLATGTSVPSKNEGEKAIAKKRGLEGIYRVGSGGRSSNAGFTSTTFGSTGFLARSIINRLAKKGVQCVAPYRGDELLARHLKPMGDLGQIVQPFFSLKDEKSIYNCVKDSHVVFNTIGRDYETSNFSFKDVHVEGPRKIAKACRETGVTRLIHVSALGASTKSPSAFLRSKAEGEEAVKQEFPDVTIIRPSNLFGTEDRFLSRIAYLNLVPVFYGSPVINDGKQILQPVFVADVAQGMINLLRDNESIGKTYEFVGPKQYEYAQLIKYFGDVCHRPTAIVNYPAFALKAYAGLMEMWPPAPVISREDIVRMGIDDVTTGLPTLDNAGVKATPLENVILSIWRTFRPPNYLDEPAPEPSALESKL